jgi:undecaprenyl-diphosphatase
MVESITNLVRGMKDRRPAILPVLILAICAGGINVFLELADEVREQELARVDNALFLLFRNAQDVADPLGPFWVEEFMTEITALGGYPILAVLVGVVIGYLLVSGKSGPALFVFLSVSSGTLVGHLLKVFYDRPRPDLVEHLVTTHTASFPSGHATMSAVVYLTLAALIVRLVDTTAVRVYVVSVAILLTIAVGISRVYLGVHWPSDVAAGWALGAAWASLSWLVVSVLKAWRDRSRSGAELNRPAPHPARALSPSPDNKNPAGAGSLDR